MLSKRMTACSEVNIWLFFFCNRQGGWVVYKLVPGVILAVSRSVSVSPFESVTSKMTVVPSIAHCCE